MERAVTLLDENIGFYGSEGWVIVQIDPLEYTQLSLRHLVEFEQRKYGKTLLIFFEPEEEV